MDQDTGTSRNEEIAENEQPVQKAPTPKKVEIEDIHYFFFEAPFTIGKILTERKISFSKVKKTVGKRDFFAIVVKKG